MKKTELIKTMLDIRRSIYRFGELKARSATEWDKYDGTENRECHAIAGARMDTEADETFSQISKMMMHIINECICKEA